tara:strand:+ start:6939 stop:7724 length:786 start_codon:yes stop_codon:yes gene_type:complete
MGFLDGKIKPRYSANSQTNFMGNTSSPSYNSPAPTGGGFVMGAGMGSSYGRGGVGETTGLQFRTSGVPNFSAMSAPVSEGPGLRFGARLMNAGNTVGSILGAVNPILGAVGAIGGIISSIGARRRAKRERRRRKRRAIRSENLLLGAAKNVVKDVEQQKLFTGEAFDIQQRQGVMNFGQSIRDAQSMMANTNLRTGTGEQTIRDIRTRFDMSQDAAQLGLDQGMYQLGQQKESRLRDIQGNLLELSAFSGRNINVLDMMGS